MGRFKPNKPRRHRPERAAMLASAPTLELPAIASETETGLVLNVAAVGLLDGLLYVRCEDEEHYVLPESLREWAQTMIASHLAYREAGHASIFPCEIEFGVLGDRAYAEMVV